VRRCEMKTVIGIWVVTTLLAGCYIVGAAAAIALGSHWTFSEKLIVGTALMVLAGGGFNLTGKFPISTGR